MLIMRDYKGPERRRRPAVTEARAVAVMLLGTLLLTGALTVHWSGWSWHRVALYGAFVVAPALVLAYIVGGLGHRRRP